MDETRSPVLPKTRLGSSKLLLQLDPKALTCGMLSAKLPNAAA